MQSKNTLICIMKCILLWGINGSTAKSGRAGSNKCQTNVIFVHSASGKRASYVMPAKTKTNGYGLVDDRIQVAIKLTEEFEYMQIRMNFGAYEYDSPQITADQLSIEKDGKWHQLWIDLEPTDLAGVDNWNLYFKSDHNTLEIDTGYVWHWAQYKPKSFNVFAKGKSYWIYRGNASVCNTLDDQLRSRGHQSMIYGRIKNSAIMVTESNLMILLLPLLLLMRIVAAQAVD